MQSGGSGAGVRQLPPHVINTVQDIGDGQKMLLTSDPTLTSLGLPSYPPLPAETEASKVEEIRRTVYVGNLPKDVDGDELMDFFNTNIGEVMYLRMTAGNDNLPCAYAYIEFSNQSSVPLALQNNGIEFKDRSLRITHSRVAIIKPQRKTADQALEEVEEAIKRDQATGVEPKKAGSVSRGYSPYAGSPRRSRRTPSPRRSRRRSSSRSRTRSPSRRRDRSRTRSRSPSAKRRRRSRDSRRRSKSRDRRSKDRDRDERRRKSRSRDRSRKRSKSRDRRRDRSRSKSKDRDRKKDRDEKKERRDKDRDKKRSRSKSRDRKDEKKSKSDRDREKDVKKEKKESKRSQSKDRDRKDKDRRSEKDSNKRDKERDRDREKSEKDKPRKYEPRDEEYDEVKLREQLLEKTHKSKSNGSGDKKIKKEPQEDMDISNGADDMDISDPLERSI